MLPVSASSWFLSPVPKSLGEAETETLSIRRHGLRRNKPTQPLDCYKQVDSFKNIVGKLEKVSPSSPLFHRSPAISIVLALADPWPVDMTSIGVRGLPQLDFRYDQSRRRAGSM